LYGPLLSIQISYGLVQFDYFVCPIEYDEVKESLSLECERAPVFKLTEYTLPKFVQSIGKVVSITDILSYPVQYFSFM